MYTRKITIGYPPFSSIILTAGAWARIQALIQEIFSSLASVVLWKIERVTEQFPGLSRDLRDSLTARAAGTATAPAAMRPRRPVCGGARWNAGMRRLPPECGGRPRNAAGAVGNAAAAARMRRGLPGMRRHPLEYGATRRNAVLPVGIQQYPRECTTTRRKHRYSSGIRQYDP